MRPTNKLMKRLSLYLFLILFTLQTPSQADDIRDFQIEGMSIGDSLLDFYSEDKIVKELSEIFKDDVKKTDEGTFILDADSSGKSTATTVNFIFNSNDFVSIQCKDWSEKMNAYDRLKVSIVLEEYDNFINNEVWD